ncbi:MAG: permease-like cell division protein FtsX [Alistipes sp.]|nr:permease-like cell division protein FtsX [Alistipes sp.]
MRNRSLKGKILRSYTVSTISITLVLFILGSIGYAMHSLFASARGVREGVVMIVELKDDLEQSHIDSLSVQISQSDVVRSVEFVSKQAKLEDEQFRRAYEVDVEAILGENPLADSFDVTLSAQAADSLSLAKFVEQTSALEGVDYISCPENLLERVHYVLDTMQFLLLAFGGAMLIISLVLLGNTLRLVIYSRREAINTMKLVGATRWFIIKPFLRRGALQGFVAALVAILLFVGSLFALDYNMPQLGIMNQIESVAYVAAAMLVAGVVVVTLFTLFAVNRFVNMKSKDIYLY